MANRSRYRTPGMFYVPGFPPGVKWLLISNVAIFILSLFAQGTALGTVFAWLALTPRIVIEGLAVWQLVTYMFLHGGFMHIIWNMLALWMFGADLERDWGTRRFLKFYFFCGVGAGICVVIVNYLLPFGNPGIATIGSSGAIFGILLAYAMMYPTRTILWGFLIPIQVRWFVLIVGAISFLSAFRGVNTGVSEFAHLGGLLFGYIYMKLPRNVGFDVIGPMRRQYHDWKIQRAKRKFQVYLKKQGSDRDKWVH
ncbi:MAG TPA: rhomboid family intramembrane serine protease [Bryobacteraceae bacterium]|nr:rhomboid family intramembrane serine protease [Bryobacteraceae bacterium]